MPRRLPYRLLLTFLLPLLLAPLARADKAHTAVVGTFDVEPNNGTPLVRVRFGDKSVGTFAIDTGAYDCMMTRTFAEKLGYKQQKNDLYLRELLTGMTPMPTTVQVPSLKINGLEVTRLQFQVSPEDIPISIRGKPLDGLLGGTFLSHFALVLDYPRHALTWIMPGDLNDATVAQLGFDPGGVIGLKQETDSYDPQKINHYALQAGLKSGDRSRTETLWIDTGAPATSISRESARRLGMSPTRTEGVGLVFKSPGLADVSEVPAMTLGSLTLSKVSVIYPRQSGFPFPTLLGESVLGYCQVLFDFGPHRFFLKPVLPGLTSAPLPDVDGRRVDWNRLANSPDPPTPDGVLATRLKADRLTGPAGRAADLRAALTEGAGDAQTYARLGSALREAQDEKGAAAAFAQAVTLRRAEVAAHPGDPEARMGYADALLLARRDEEAETAASEAVAALPTSPLVWRSRGVVLETCALRLQFGRSSGLGAEDDLLRPDASGNDPPEEPKAETARRIKRLRQAARESFDRAVTLAPADAHGFLARALFWMAEHELMSTPVTQEVQTVEVIRPLGTVVTADDLKTVTEMGTDLSGYLADCQRYVRLNAADPSALRLAVLLDRGLPEFHDRKWLLKHDPCGGALLRDGTLMTAASAVSALKALTQDTDKIKAATAWNTLGAVQDAQDDQAGAEASWRKALALDGVQAGAWGGLARLLLSQDRENDLAEALMALLTRSDAPSGEQALPLRLLLAATLRDMNIADDAEAQARLALQSAPDCGEANRMLAGLLLAHGRSDPAALAEAAACLTRANAAYGPGVSGPVKSSLQTMQAVLTSLNGDPTQGRQLLLDLLHAEPESTEAREALAALTLPAP